MQIIKWENAMWCSRTGGDGEEGVEAYAGGSVINFFLNDAATAEIYTE